MAIGYPPRARAADARRESIFRRGHSRRAQRTPSPKPASQRSRAAPAVRSNGGDPGPGVARLSLPRQRGGRRPAAAAGLGVSQACNVWARAVEDRRRRGPTDRPQSVGVGDLGFVGGARGGRRARLGTSVLVVAARRRRPRRRRAARWTTGSGSLSLARAGCCGVACARAVACAVPARGRALRC
jgi:hypothetical protein